MSGNSMDRRIRRLERDHGLAALPWDRPGSEWTDAQLLQYLGLSGMPDGAFLLAAISKPNALFIGMRECASSEEWEANCGE